MFKDVKALLSDSNRSDLEFYSKKASTVEGDYLEVGSYLGGSALHIMQEMPLFKKIFCCDPWGVNFLKFRENIIKYKQWERVVPITNDYRVLPQYLEPKQKFAFIFVDNDHTYENTALPVLVLWPFLSMQAYFLFHDYGHPNYPGVKKFIDTFIEYDFLEKVDERDGLFIVRKTGELTAKFISKLHHDFHTSAKPDDLVHYHRIKSFELQKRHNKQELELLRQRLYSEKCELPEDKILLFFYKFFKDNKNPTALYGAGAHSEWLLAWLEEWGMADYVTTIIDKEKKGQLKGRPIVRPQDLDTSIETILISSDTYHQVLYDQAIDHPSLNDKNIVDPYHSWGQGPFEKWEFDKFI